MKICDLDYETRSELDVRDVGAITYAQHPSTEIICLAYKIDDNKTKIWIPSEVEWIMPRDLVEALANPECILIAHNALFEQMVTKYTLLDNFYKTDVDAPDIKPIPISRWRCSAAKAASCGIPRKLEHAGAALKLTKQKDMVGHKFMLKHSMPRPVWRQWDRAGRIWNEPAPKYFEDPDERKKIYSYCIRDVKVEHELYNRLPDLTPYEQKVWELNQKTNIKGVLIDIPVVEKIIGFIKIETKRLNKKLAEITEGRVEKVNSVAQFTNWVRDTGFTIPNLQAETVTDLIAILEKKDSPRAKQVEAALRIRQVLGKISLKKYPAMLERVSRDNRIKDYSMYWGAHTGREAGRGLQLQNLPARGKIKNTDLAIDIIKESDLEEIRFLYRNPIEVFSSCIRGMVLPSEGFELHAADYNAIEARVLLWMAGDEKGLKNFANKYGPYKLIAAKLYGVNVIDVTEPMRDIGKRVELGCGFGMGGPKFLKTCHKHGAKDVTLEFAKRAVAIYRKEHPKVQQMWKNLEEAAIRAVRKPGRVVKVNRTSWKVEGEFLTCTLPSGRKLRYYGPRIKSEMAPWEEMTPRLYHWHVNSLTKKWEFISTYGGKLTENVVQATARDIMVNGTLKCVENGYAPLFSVHDEVISERKIGKGSPEEYANIITTLPAWAKGLPISAKGWKGPRYKKV